MTLVPKSLLSSPNILALLFGLCVTACASSSNYAPVIYHQTSRITGGAAVISQGDPAAEQTSGDPSLRTAAASRVEAEPLGVTGATGMTSENLPPPGSRRIEAELPHGVMPNSDQPYVIDESDKDQASQEQQAEPETQINSRPLVIAKGAPVPVGKEQPYEVMVQPGDTLYSLARTHDVTRKSIIEANDLKPPYGLLIGTQLVIPKGNGTQSANMATTAPDESPSASEIVATSTGPDFHVVKRGDTLYSIAKSQHADVRELALLNNIEPPYYVKLGQKLKLKPGAKETSIASNARAPKPANKGEGGPLLHTGEAPVPPAGAGSFGGEHKTNTPSANKSQFIWPVSGRIISAFGVKGPGRRNDGVNIAAPIGTAVRATRAGEVIYVGNELRGYGNLVLVRHDDGYVSAYAHNSRILVKRGAFVQQGQVIAESGETGSVSQPQVHFEIRKDRKPIDPMNYLPKV